MVRPNYVEIQGMLREVDLERRSCQVYPRASASIDCLFEEEHEPLVKVLLDTDVLICGSVTQRTPDGRVKELAIRDIQAIEQPTDRPTPHATSKPRTGRELLASLRATGLVGMWKDRQDIGDSSDFARKLRERAQRRERE